MKKFLLFVIPFLMIAGLAIGQTFSISGKIVLKGTASSGSSVKLLPSGQSTTSDENGFYHLEQVGKGAYELVITDVNARSYHKNVTVKDQDVVLNITLDANATRELQGVTVTATDDKVAGKLRQVEGTAIYAGKKTEVINMANINANLATNNARQVYGRIVGLNIWEYDGGGLQLGIGGRGLNPSRVSNFNTRQNGYDISADALGYPESYYAPANEAIDKIEIIRGAASLQYGTQFGGLINFKLKRGPQDKPFELVSRQTVGSWGFLNTFNSVGGTYKKLNYYAFFQYKRGDSWRPNSHYNQQASYIHLDYDLTSKLKITGEYSFMHYLAQQPGGLTDADFEKDPSISVRERNWFKVNWNLISVSLDYKFSEKTKLNLRNYILQAGRDALGILSYINRPDPGGARDMMSDVYQNYGSELRLLHQYTLFNKQTSTFLIGGRLYKGLTKRSQGAADTGSGPAFKYLDPANPNESDYNFPGTNMSAFAENIFQITDKWSITPGARFEYISTKADGYYYQKLKFVEDQKKYEQKENNRSFVLFGIGTSYKLANGAEAYANISQNYRSINFNDLRVLNANARVDSNLKDETGYTIDGGMRGYVKDWLYYDISVFYLKYNNRIGSIFTKDADNMVYRLRTNIADSRNIGFESLIEADILKAINHASKYKLSVYTNLAIIDARYINTKDNSIKDKLVEYVPPVLFRSGLSFGNKKMNVTWQYSYVAKQYSDATNAEYTPTAVDGAVPSYVVMDLSLSYQWKRFGVFGSINNIANAKYFTRRADGYPGPGIIPSDGRGFYLTLQVKI